MNTPATGGGRQAWGSREAGVGCPPGGTETSDCRGRPWASASHTSSLGTPRPVTHCQAHTGAPEGPCRLVKNSQEQGRSWCQPLSWDLLPNKRLKDSLGGGCGGQRGNQVTGTRTWGEGRCDKQAEGMKDHFSEQRPSSSQILEGLLHHTGARAQGARTVRCRLPTGQPTGHPAHRARPGTHNVSESPD